MARLCNLHQIIGVTREKYATKSCGGCNKSIYQMIKMNEIDMIIHCNRYILRVLVNYVRHRKYIILIGTLIYNIREHAI